MVNTKGLILHKTGYKRGRKHDYDIYKHNHPVTPPQVENVFDLGYLGVEKDFTTVKSVLPIRKKRNKMLSYEETTYNKKAFSIEDYSRTHHSQTKEVWDNGY
ncbi:MAG TPA: hypothetical protein VFJ05_07370 [Nitrososphaeraceae archaeon]|nr:hypothetical protein [Nitrososphaeraceae archaeon]